MPAGTPRGFNLQNFGMNAIAPLQSFGAGFPPFFAGAVQAPPGWVTGGAERGGGPIRRGVGRFPNNARTGPYDRRPSQRYETGRLSPTRGGSRGSIGSAGGRWGDGASGGAAVGPREAVQGRSLKSYEDLDAVAGGGSGELNY